MYFDISKQHGLNVVVAQEIDGPVESGNALSKPNLTQKSKAQFDLFTFTMVWIDIFLLDR